MRTVEASKTKMRTGTGTKNTSYNKFTFIASRFEYIPVRTGIRGTGPVPVPEPTLDKSETLTREVFYQLHSEVRTRGSLSRNPDPKPK
jgi:hypothetical protein